MEARFVANTSKVLELQETQRQLEARNALLETVAETCDNSDQQAPSVVSNLLSL